MTHHGAPPACAVAIVTAALAVGAASTSAALPWESAGAARRLQPLALDTALGHAVTIAGAGGRGFAGDGGPAQRALLNAPRGLCLSGATVFVCDTGNARVRAIHPNGTITTVAGSGVEGYGGDGGPATLAMLDSPSSCALDYSGDLFITDTGNHAIRRVARTSGVIDTVVGRGRGRAAFADGAPTFRAELSSPWGLAFDEWSNLFIHDTGNNCYRLLSRTAQVVTTVPAADLWSLITTSSSPSGLAATDSGELLIQDWVDERLFWRNPSTRVIHLVPPEESVDFGRRLHVALAVNSSDGPATSVSLIFAYGLAFDRTGTLYIADAESSRVRMLQNGSSSTATPTGSASPSASVSTTASASGTTSQTRTKTASRTNTGTMTITRTSSQTWSRTNTPTLTNTPTGSASPSASTSAAATASRTATQTRSQTTSRTNTPTLTNTPTGSASPSASASTAATASRTATRTSSQTRSRTNTPTLTNTSSGSASPSSSATKTETGLPTRSATSTKSGTNTASPSVSAATLTTPAATAMPSPTSTGSATGSPTPTPSMAASSSASATLTAPATASRSLAPTPTASATLSPGASSSTSASMAPALFGASIAAIATDSQPAGGAAADTLSAAAPPLMIGVALSPLQPTRVLGAPLQFVCNATGEAAPQLVIRVVQPAGAAAVFVGQVVNVSVAAAYMPADYEAVSPTLRANVTCTAAMATAPFLAASATLGVTVVRRLWPFFGSALVQYPSHTRAYAGSAAAAGVPLSIVLMGRTNMTLRSDGSGTWLPGGPAFDNRTTVSIGNASCRVWHVTADGRALDFETPSFEDVCGAASDLRGAAGCPAAALTVANPGQVAISCPPFCPGASPAPVAAGFGGLDVAGGGAAGTPLLSAARGRLYGGGVQYVRNCTDSGFTDPTTGACADAGDPRSRGCTFGATSCDRCPVGALCPGGLRAWPQPGFWSSGEASPELLPCALPATRCRGWSPSAAVVECDAGYAAGSVVCSLCAAGYYVDAGGACTQCPPVASFFEAVETGASFLGTLSAFALLWVAVCLWLAPKDTLADVAGSLRRSQRVIAGLFLWVFLVVQAQVQVGVAGGAGLPPAFAVLYERLGLFAFQGLAVPAACVPDANPLTWTLVQLSVLLALWLTYLALLMAWIVQRWRGAAVAGADWGATTAAGSSPAVGWGAPPAPSSPPDSKPGAAAAVALPTALQLICYLLMITYSVSALNVIESVTCDRTKVTVSQYVGNMFGDNSTLAAFGVPPLAPLAPDADADAVAAHQAQGQRVLDPVWVLRANPSIVCYEGGHRPVAALAWLLLFSFVLAFPLLTASLVVCTLGSQLTLFRRGGPRRSVLTSSPQTEDDAISEEVASRQLYEVKPFVTSFFRPSCWAFWQLDYGVLMILPALAAIRGDSAGLAADCARFVLVLLLAAVVGALYCARRPYAAGLEWMLVPKLLSLVMVSVLAALQFCVAATTKLDRQPEVIADASTADSVAQSRFGFAPGASATLVQAEAALAYTTVALSAAIVVLVLLGFARAMRAEVRWAKSAHAGRILYGLTQARMRRFKSGSGTGSDGDEDASDSAAFAYYSGMRGAAVGTGARDGDAAGAPPVATAKRIFVVPRPPVRASPAAAENVGGAAHAAAAETGNGGVLAPLYRVSARIRAEYHPTVVSTAAAPHAAAPAGDGGDFMVDNIIGGARRTLARQGSWR